VSDASGRPAGGDEPRRRGRWRRNLLRVALIAVGLFAAIQLIPYGRAHDNPPTTAAIRWDSPRTEQLFMTACADCHSNLTRWPWYTNVAPVSWLVQHDVDEGRSRMNVSDASRGIDIEEVARVLREGGMPPLQYTLKHRDANLSSADREALIAGMRTTFAARLRSRR
jgi:mono/diheme cytochrome c family protein